MAISPELNRQRVRAAQENVDRLNIYLPKGTNDRIEALGFKRSAFAKDLILAELDRLESLKR